MWPNRERLDRGKPAADDEPAAPTAFCLDRAARSGDDVLDDREAEAAPARGARSVGAEEPLEEPGSILFGHAGAVVARTEDDRTVFSAERDDAGRSLTGVADRVLEQILDDGPQHAAPERDEQRLVLDPELEADARALGALKALVDRRAQDRRGLGLAERDYLASLLELAQEQDVVHELGHLLDLAASLPEQCGQVGARELGRLEQRDESRERRPQLMGDSSRERHSELFVFRSTQ